jgi:hydrogenase large subunit
MSKKVELRIPLNRVEGDLDIKVSIEDGIITNAKSVGTLYRGFENILTGREPMDALVITPRVCGICSISHLQASVNALEDAYDITPPPQAVRLRNISVMCENMQSDLKQLFLMFMADFSHEYYKKYDFFKITKSHYEPFHGKLSKSILQATKDILKIVAYIGGQWPHTSHMIPGGLSVISDDLEVLRIRYLVIKFKQWMEEEIFKASFDEVKEIDSFKSLEAFIDKHPQSHISYFYKVLKEANLLHIGSCGYGFINYGSIQNSDGSFVIPKGIYEDGAIKELDTTKITEDLSHAWYQGENTHPFKSTTVPNVNKDEAYSFSKAPRYDNKAYQTGPLGEELIYGNKLFIDLHNRFGDSLFVREFARFLRPLRYVELMEREIEDVIKNINEPIYSKAQKPDDSMGVGLTHAARGALGHWIKIVNGKIDKYQIISPTTWNGSPMDENGNLGAWEKALIGVEIKDVNNPMELGHVIRSFDPCLVCTVHFVGSNIQKMRLKV